MGNTKGPPRATNLPQVIPGWNKEGDGYEISLNEAGARQLIDMLHQCISEGKKVQGEVYQGKQRRSLVIEISDGKPLYAVMEED